MDCLSLLASYCLSASVVLAISIARQYYHFYNPGAASQEYGAAYGVHFEWESKRNGCTFLPECQKCSMNRPEDWTTERPEGFPSIDRDPARYLPGFAPEAFIEGRRFLGESDR
jgi:hypothetical protein